MNVSNGAGGAPVGAAGSLIMNLQRNGTTVFSVDPLGNPTAANVAVAANNVTYLADVIAGGIPIFKGRTAGGTVGSLSATQSGAFLAFFGGAGFGATGYQAANAAAIAFLAAENFSDTAAGTAITFNTTPTGGSLIRAEAGRFTPSGGLSVKTTTDPGAGLIIINSGSFLMRNASFWNDGASTSVGTLTNAPRAGNPTKWIAIDDNATTRYVPSW